MKAEDRRSAGQQSQPGQFRVLVKGMLTQCQAFVRSAIASSAAVLAIALNHGLSFGTFHPVGLSARALAIIRDVCEVGFLRPMLWPEPSRSRAIFQEVFIAQGGLAGRIFAPSRRVEFRPDRSVWGGALTLRSASGLPRLGFDVVRPPPRAARRFSRPASLEE
jgi:hypothetical protein